MTSHGLKKALMTSWVEQGAPPAPPAPEALFPTLLAF